MVSEHVVLNLSNGSMAPPRFMKEPLNFDQTIKNFSQEKNYG
jgi:hypothetical protein